MKKKKRETIKACSLANPMRPASSEKHAQHKTITPKVTQVEPKQVRLSSKPKVGKKTDENRDPSHAMPLPPPSYQIKHVKKITNKGKPTVITQGAVEKVPDNAQ